MALALTKAPKMSTIVLYDSEKEEIWNLESESYNGITKLLHSFSISSLNVPWKRHLATQTMDARWCKQFPAFMCQSLMHLVSCKKKKRYTNHLCLNWSIGFSKFIMRDMPKGKFHILARCFITRHFPVYLPATPKCEKSAMHYFVFSKR